MASRLRASRSSVTGVYVRAAIMTILVTATFATEAPGPASSVARVPCADLPELIGLSGIAPVKGLCSHSMGVELSALSTSEVTASSLEDASSSDAPASIPDPDSWIVQLSDKHAASLEGFCGEGGWLSKLGISCEREYGHVFAGFTSTLPRENLAAFLSLVGLNATAVHADSEVRLSDVESVATSQSQLEDDATTRSGTWGLDRIDQTSLPLDGLYHYYGRGTGVNAYVVDTGIRLTHEEFLSADGSTDGSRADAVFTAFDTADDCQGHGTHVASCVGGLTFGVAKDVRLHALRVLDCDGRGSVSSTLAALDWIVANGTKPAVVTLSLVGDVNAALDAAVDTARAAGFLVAVAAGNTVADACDYSPGRTSGSLTVGASDRHDGLLYVAEGKGTNYGSCVDLFAPGDTILGADYISDVATKFRSGTSQSVPFVAGLGVLLISNSSGQISSDELAQRIIAMASEGQLSSSIPSVTFEETSTPNLLLRTTSSAAPSPAAAPSPSATTPKPSPARAPAPPPPIAAAASASPDGSPGEDDDTRGSDAPPPSSESDVAPDLAPFATHGPASPSPSAARAPAPVPAPAPAPEGPAPAPGPGPEGPAPAPAPGPEGPVPAPSPAARTSATTTPTTGTVVTTRASAAVTGTSSTATSADAGWSASTGTTFPPPPPAPIQSGFGSLGALLGRKLLANAE